MPLLSLGAEAVAILMQILMLQRWPESPDDIFTTSWPLRVATDLLGILEVLGM